MCDRAIFSTARIGSPQRAAAHRHTRGRTVRTPHIGSVGLDQTSLVGWLGAQHRRNVSAHPLRVVRNRCAANGNMAERSCWSHVVREHLERVLEWTLLRNFQCIYSYCRTKCSLHVVRTRNSDRCATTATRFRPHRRARHRGGLPVHRRRGDVAHFHRLVIVHRRKKKCAAMPEATGK